MKLWDDLPGWAKIAVVVGGAGLGYALFFGGLSVRRYLLQNGPWGGRLLGNSSSLTIGSAGCMLTSLTMAANLLTGTDWDPPDAQEIILAGGGFSGGLLKLPTAASTLGLSAPEKERIHPHASVDALRARIDDALAKGGVAMVNVDKAYTGTGEHFILVTKKTMKGYAGADPATGKDTFLDPSTLSGVAMWGKVPHTYDVVGVAPIYKA